MPIPTALAHIYGTESFIDSIRRALDHAPELKHENHFSTEISIHLNSSLRLRSEREVRMPNRRRVDLRLDDDLVEAKYHYEGDLDSIGSALDAASINSLARQNLLDKNYQSAPKDMVQQAISGDAHWLLWFVAIRDIGAVAPFRLPALIGKFYVSNNVQSLTAAHQAAAAQAYDIAKGPFAKLRGVELSPILLPTIEARKGALVTILIPLPKRGIKTVSR